MHFPEGASKKDGPSAGIAIASALISIALDKHYNPNFAMTGEISLNGKVLKIGGLKEKSLAAKREGVSNIICPKDNEGDFKEMKSFITEGLNFHFVKDY
jgi:ATP-dependent Lon protease